MVGTTQKPRRLARRLLAVFLHAGETAFGLMPKPREPKPGEFWTDDLVPLNHWAKAHSGAQVLEVRDGWVRFERVVQIGEHPPSINERHERISTFALWCEPPQPPRE